MKKKPKLTPTEQKLLVEAMTEQPLRLGAKKSEQKGFSDLPLFDQSNRQRELF